MLALRVIQAEFGDCLVVEFGTPEDRRYALFDGGPPGTYNKHLEPVLKNIAAEGGRLDLAVLSHVDNDHVAGLLELTMQLREQRVNGQIETIAVDALWHNSFARMIDKMGDLMPHLKVLIESVDDPKMMELSGMAVDGISEGDQLRLDALALKIPINNSFPNDLVCVDTSPDPMKLGNLTVSICGPTYTELDELEKEWRKWLDKCEIALITGEPDVAAMTDKSVPNLSSIAVLVEAKGNRILLTGDGRGDHLLAGLQQAGLLDYDGTIKIDILKVSHHGSNRNATREFFDRVKARIYVISANGQYGNPDLATLIWIVESSKKDVRDIELVLTNPTPSSDKLMQEYPPTEYRYKLTVMPAEDDSIVLDAKRGM